MSVFEQYGKYSLGLGREQRRPFTAGGKLLCLSPRFSFPETAVFSTVKEKLMRNIDPSV